MPEEREPVKRLGEDLEAKKKALHKERQEKEVAAAARKKWIQNLAQKAKRDALRMLKTQPRISQDAARPAGETVEPLKTNEDKATQPTTGGRGIMAWIKPIREWKPKEWFKRKAKEPAFDLDRYAVPREPQPFMQYLHNQFGINYLPQEVLEAQIKVFGRTAAYRQVDIEKNPEPIARAIEMIAQKKKGNPKFFDVFNRPFGGLFNRRQNDINAIQFYYRMTNQGKELKRVELGNGTKVAINDLSAQHARKIRTHIETSLKKGAKLNQIDLLVTKARGKVQEPEPKIFGWMPEKPALKAAGAMVAGATAAALFTQTPPGQVATDYWTKQGSRPAQQTPARRAQVLESIAEKAVKAHYKSPKNYGVNVTQFTQEWLNHRNRVGAAAGEAQAKDFVRQWNDHVRKVGGRKAVLSRTDLIAFLKSRTYGGMPEVGKIADAALKQ